jgi:ribosomal protein S12 methylthiotransferase accessory factor
VETDRPVNQGGGGGAPTPYELFLASLGTCTGSVVLGFCLKRNIPHEGISLRQRAVHAEGPRGKRTLEKIVTEITLPPGFPEKYRAALLRATGQCSVKRAVQASPAFEVRAVVRPG